MARDHRPTTSDEPRQDKAYRVTVALKKSSNWTRSNRELAIELRVDEGMVRRYRAKLKVPKLLPGSGLPAPERAKKRKK